MTLFPTQDFVGTWPGTYKEVESWKEGKLWLAAMQDEMMLASIMKNKTCSKRIERLEWDFLTSTLQKIQLERQKIP